MFQLSNRKMLNNGFLRLLLLTLTLCGVRGHGNHGHGTVNMQAPTSFNDPNVIGDQAHMKEHLKNEIRTDKDISPEEMEFHYFRLHDTNNDTMLDGLELMKALSHMMPPGMEVMPHEVQGKTAADIEKLRAERIREMLNGFVMFVDKVFENDDVDKDGYLTYPEYIVARRRDNKAMRRAQAEMLKQAEAYKQQQAAMANQPKTTFNI